VAKRPYTSEFRARQNPQRYLLSGIPPTLWERVRRKARAEHISVRAKILTLLQTWLQEPDAVAGPSASEVYGQGYKAGQAEVRER
jgi:hypothetical protein